MTRVNGGAALKVALIPTQFPSPAETFISGRVKALGELGCAVSVYALRNEHPRAAELAKERGVESVPRSHTEPVTLVRGTLRALARPALLVRFLAWVVGSTSNDAKQLLKSLVLTPRAFEILAALERDTPDVVHAEWGHYPSLVLWLVQRRMPGVVTSIGLIAHDLDLGLGCTVAATRGSQLVRSSTLENVAQIRALTGVPAERIEVIYDGVDVDAIDEVTRRTQKVPGRVVVVARLVDEKRIDHVIEAFALAARAEPTASLHVLGEGPERSKLEALAESLGLAGRTRFLGHVSHDLVREEVAQAEVLALLSETERLPNVVKEGMAARCVCITTRTNGIGELVEHGVTGFVLGHGEQDEAGRLMAWAMRERAAAVAMGEDARRFVGERFDHMSNVGRFVDAWLEARASLRQAASAPSAHRTSAA